MQKPLLILILFITSLGFAQQQLNVLFIGNSYTYANDLPGTLVQLAAAMGDQVNVDSKTNGGFTFQMQAMMNIEVLNAYEAKKIVTACPHCFNTLKNEYPTLGGNYEVIHHSQLLAELISAGKIKASEDSALEQVAYHDSCYLGRGNGVYEAPREIISGLKKEYSQSHNRYYCCY